MESEKDLLLQVLSLGERDIAAGRYRDVAVFLAELDSEDDENHCEQKIDNSAAR